MIDPDRRPCGATNRRGFFTGRLGRRHAPARMAIERKVEELAGMDLWRLPEPKVEALLQVADVVTEYYGIGDRLEAWADRIPVQESFSPQSGGHAGVLSYWQPAEPVPGAGWPVDWWLFLSPEPIDWGSLDDLPIFARPTPGRRDLLRDDRHRKKPDVRLSPGHLAS